MFANEYFEERVVTLNQLYDF
ncbi:hypothetical protein NSMM_90067 [Nitrosomonas mobilis]|uniref:Uncharacterized protein n=1 Tax=Nitrosomonas mobilis TaxID=51642 RepID=A0A1G5SJN7_9PROT|nr:hypothetical protein NSMM_90067 [Nitrosomonas mobilis]